MSKVLLAVTLSQGRILRLPRNYFGAIFGIVVFLILAIVSGVIKQFQFLNIGLILPGTIIFTLVVLPFNLHFPIDVINVFYYLFSFGISSIPAGFIGSRLFSINESVGIGLLIIYLFYLLSVIVIGYLITGNFYFDATS